jgi:BirA family transcriptional regulator, biotin operon repressor / biotin---[acetyl-CoA-carboxylase] ligase
MTPSYSPEAIMDGLATERLGRVVYCYDQVTSTNDVARELARVGVADGTLVVAEEQTAGRGRRGRSWLAPPGTALLASLVLRPPLAPAQAARLTMLAAVATREAIRGVSGLTPGLKWPNDVMILGRKVAGILAETESGGDRPHYAVLGIGVNVNGTAEQMAAISGQAISMAMATGHEVSRLRLLQLLLAEMEVRYTAMRRDGGRAVQEEWQKYLETLGQMMELNVAHETMRGKAEAVDSDGALLVRCGDGRLVRVLE